MTDTRNDNDTLLESAIEEVLSARASQKSEDAAIERVRSRLLETRTIASDRPLEGCADYQSLIPELLDGSLSEARALLVRDHTRECVPCRRVLMAQRSGQPDQSATHTRPLTRRVPTAFRMAAAALIVVALGTLGLLGGLDYAADRSLRAEVTDIDGSLQLVTAAGMQTLADGTELRARQAVRTAKDSGAMIRLADGSVVEMADRSQISLTAGRRGTTIDLHRGNVIVHAAPQGSGRLYLATNQCEVAVKGTIFSVNHGLKGSRVSVIEGLVEVSYSGNEAMLEPGEQVSTSVRLAAVPVEDEIAWSRNAEQHRALLAELSQLQREISHAVHAAASERTSTQLLDLTPANAMMYMSLPNLTEGLTTAHEVFEARLATSEALRTWWEEEVVAKGYEAEIDAFFDRLLPFGEALGEEIVVTLSSDVINGHGGPIILADLRDPVAFEQVLRVELERITAEAECPLPIHLVDSPNAVPSVENGFLMWITGDLMVAAASPTQLQTVAAALANPGANPFSETAMYSGLSDAYDRGVAWLLGVDLATAFETTLATSDSQELDLLERLGVLDATILIAERRYDGDNVTLQATLDFKGPRRGIASWLAEPAPMGSLEFVSPEAKLTVAVAAKDAADMFDELIDAVGSLDTGVTTGLDELRTQYGFDLRNDLAATFGGEAAFAIDGPIVPMPSWKLVAEVYDPATLQATIERSVEEVNRRLEAESQQALVFTTTNEGSRTYSALSRPGFPTEMHWTVVDGYLVAGPSRAMLDRAIQHRNSGANLPNSAAFLNLLPKNGFTDFSAVVYRNLGPMAETLGSLGLEQMFGENVQHLDFDLLAAPSLYCVWGEERRITIGGTGPDLLAIAPLAAFGSLFDTENAQSPASTVVDQVSSAG